MQTIDQTASAIDDDALELTSYDTKTQAEKGYPLRLVPPGASRPSKAVIVVRGHDSPTYQAKKHDMTRANMERARKKQGADRTPEEAEQDAIEILVASTINWSGMKINGVEHPYSEENARKLYAQYPWIYEQVDRAIHNRANFLPGSATT